MSLPDVHDRVSASPEVRFSPARHTINIVASFLVMASAGSVYAWSIFVEPLREGYGYTTAETQLVFGLIIACFSIMMLFVGRIERHLGLKLTTIIGAVLFAAGYLIASISGGKLWIIIAGISVLSGAGMAFGYVTVLANLVKWYPRHKGLATGLAVAGFGSGAILLSQTVQPFIDRGINILEMFRYIGIGYGILYLLCALLIRRAPGGNGAGNEPPLPLSKLLRSRSFYVLTITFFAGSFSGLMLIGNLKPLALSYGAEAATVSMAIVIVSLGNASGRVIWGYIFDHIGGMRCVTVALSCLAVLMLFLPVALPASVPFVILCLFIGLFFGANFVIYASDVSHIYGVEQVGFIYPFVSLGYGVSGIAAPIAGGIIYDVSGSYFPAIILSSVVCLAGMVLYAVSMRKSSPALPSTVSEDDA